MEILAAPLAEQLAADVVTTGTEGVVSCPEILKIELAEEVHDELLVVTV